MTYEQAETIRYLSHFPEIKIFIQVQEEKRIAEMKAQCSKGKDTPHGDFLHQSGKIEGHKAASFIEILYEAKAIIEQKNKENDKI